MSHTCAVAMTDQVAIVTNAHDGIGFETAKEFAKRGAKVIIGSPSEDKGEVARDIIVEETGNSNVIVKYVDLEDLGSIWAFALDILQTEVQLHILINNPGAPIVENDVTCDGLTTEIQVYHFAPFLLTMLLLPLLKASSPSRIINAYTLLHWLGRYDDDDIDELSPLYVNYSQNIAFLNFASVMFTTKLSRHLEGTGVTVNCLYRGMIDTDEFPPDDIFSKILQKLFAETASVGAQPTIHLATCPNLINVSGKYFRDNRQTQPCDQALNTKDADMLWLMSNLVVFGKNE